MIAQQTNIVPITQSETAVLTIRETAQYDRVLVIRNLSASEVTVRINHSLTGTAPWTLVDTAVLGVGDTQVFLIPVASSGTLQITTASTNSYATGLLITLLRVMDDSNHVWVSPKV